MVKAMPRRLATGLATRQASRAIRRRLRGLVAFIVLAAALGASPTVPSARSTGLTVNRPEFVTGHERYERLCTRLEVRAVFVRFVDAFNRGDLKRLDRVFAREPDFEWYSTQAPGERFNEVARNRSSLIPYFAERHALAEHLKVGSFQWNGGGNFEYGLVRSANDLQPTRYYGKGAAHCYPNPSDTIFVWSMGRE
jgi:hypothetical protein